MANTTDTRNVRILLDCEEFEMGDALRERLRSKGAVTEIKCFSVQQEEPLSKRFSHVVAILPRAESQLIEERERVQWMIQRLHCLATIPHTQDGRTLVIVQFGGGQFGTGAASSSIDVCCAASFARSLHLERSDLRIRVIDLPPAISPDDAATRIAEEMDGAEPFVSVGYDELGRRRLPVVRIQQPAAYQLRNQTWTEDDVVLVTGGAKGITAACALGLARATGARFALVGRSPAPVDLADAKNEIAETLRQFAAAGTEAHYFQCDVADADDVAALVAQVRQHFGPITGILHGAGLNAPRRAETVSIGEAFREVAPKLLGAIHLCRALESSPPRMIMGLTSIIGITGMPGNAWYAFSNEALDLLLRRFAAQHPQTQVQSVAFSIWGEVGMGHRLKSVETLGRMGISAIPTEEGVRRCVQLWEFDPGAPQVVITARLGGLDTWPMEPVHVSSAFRFVERLVSCHPQVELVSRTRLTLDRDPYLADHNFRGSYLFPTVFGLEAMAQAAAVVTGQPAPQICRIENISLERPIVVDPQRGVEIELRALAEEANERAEITVCVEIRSEQTGFAVPHFSAQFVLGTPTREPQTNHSLKVVPLDIDPRTDLYGDLLFQGPMFQRMGSILELDSDHTVFESDCRDVRDLAQMAFGEQTPSTLLLGDPFLRDVLLQAGQLTIPQEVCLPVRIDCIERFGTAGASPGRRIVAAPFKVRQGNEYVAEIYVTDDHGRMLERLTGYRLRILNERENYPTALELAAPDERDTRLVRIAIESATSDLNFPHPAVAVTNLRGLHDLPRSARREREHPVISRALADWQQRNMPDERNSDVDWLPNGKPVIRSTRDAAIDLSLTHDEGCCICVVGSGAQGCDVLPITHREPFDWYALLGNHRTPLFEDLIASGDSPDEAGTRIWTAVESVRKATQAGDIALASSQRQGERVIIQAVTETDVLSIATFPLRLTRGPQRMFALVLSVGNRSLAEHHSSPKPIEAGDSRLTTDEGGIHPFCHGVDVAVDGPQGQPVQQLRFVVSFQEASTISRHVPAAQYLKWMGRMRELVTSVNVPGLVDLIATGNWGLVTNWGDVHVHGELTANDVVQMRFWTNQAHGSEVEFYCDFWRQQPDGSWAHAAFAEQKATWVRLLGHGQVQAAPFPPELAAFIERMGPRDAHSTTVPHLSKSLETLDRGQALFTAPPGPGGARCLYSKSFETTLEEANLVGNVYFANYFSWQRKVRDLFLHSIARQYHLGIGAGGEMICLRSRMDYLREAMPFDEIEVVMSLQALTTCGATFRFDFYCRLPEGGRRKLSVGMHEVVWVRRDARGTPVSTAWPEEVRKAMQEAAKRPHYRHDETDAAAYVLSTAKH